MDCEQAANNQWQLYFTVAHINLDNYFGLDGRGE
jgi:hypothetical protein